MREQKDDLRELVTWGQPVDEDQGQALQAELETLGIGPERSAAGDARQER